MRLKVAFDPPRMADPTGLARLRASAERHGVNLALSGIDGSGKSSLTAMLARTLDAEAIPTTVEHRFRWFDTLLSIPCLMMANRLRRRRVLIFNRCFLDTLAHFFPATRAGHVALRAAARAWTILTPGFDRIIYLYVPYDETLRRGRMFAHREYARLTANYDLLTEVVPVLRLPSNPAAFAVALESLTHDPRAPRRSAPRIATRTSDR